MASRPPDENGSDCDDNSCHLDRRVRPLVSGAHNLILVLDGFEPDERNAHAVVARFRQLSRESGFAFTEFPRCSLVVALERAGKRHDVRKVGLGAHGLRHSTTRLGRNSGWQCSPPGTR